MFLDLRRRFIFGCCLGLPSVFMVRENASSPREPIDSPPNAIPVRESASRVS
jgi:hypothetical protein